MLLILHIVEKQAWRKAKQQNIYAPQSLHSEGFIHCSTPETVVEVANHLFRGQSGLLLLCIDLDKVEAQVLFERVGNQERWIFPHIYGALNVDAVVREVEFEPNAFGLFTLPTEC
jgi:uncharacterized protein (DUF952 family)